MFWDVFRIVLFYDVWFYGIHRALHTYPILAVYHKIHHQIPSDRMTFWDASRAHLVENVLINTGFVLPLCLFPTSLLSGAVAYSLISLRGLLQHDPRGIPWIGRHHLDHHSHPQYNFSSYPVDRFFGTIKPSL